MSKYQELSTKLWDQYKVADHPAIAFALDMSWHADLKDNPEIEMFMRNTDRSFTKNLQPGWESLDFFIAHNTDLTHGINRRSCQIIHQRKIDGPILVIYKEHPKVTRQDYSGFGVREPTIWLIAYDVPPGLFGNVRERTVRHVVSDVYQYLAHGIKI